MSDPLLSAINNTVQSYFLGMHHRDIAMLRRIFHPDAQLFGYLVGEFEKLSLSQWLDKISHMPIPSENGEIFSMQIVTIDISGGIACVKVKLLYHGLQFIDYLSLVEIDSRWLIVNKTFSSQ